jgi:photosystem II stability/assembly factor-like uncharacterized protein
VFRTTNDGVTWDRKALHAEQGSINALCVAPNASNMVYAGGYTYDVSSIQHARLFKSTNAGSTWTASGTSTFNAVNQMIEAIAVDPWNASKILVATYGSIFISTDAGATWAKQSQTLYTYALLAHPLVANKFYAGTGSGVWESTNGGVTWTMINNGLTSLTVLSLAFDATNVKLFAGTDGGGVFRLDVATDVDGRTPEVPSAFALEQNYPNPFNPVTSIGYTVGGIGNQASGFSNVKLSVYDVLGREVAVLMDARKAPGRYTATFDGARLSSGTYIYRLEATGDGIRYVASKVMTLIR